MLTTTLATLWTIAIQHLHETAAHPRSMLPLLAQTPQSLLSHRHTFQIDNSLIVLYCHSRVQADAAACTNPCWTSDARNQGMIAYMLNMEYLLAESYSCWATGSGIPDALRGGGPPSIGCQQMAFQDPLVAVRHSVSDLKPSCNPSCVHGPDPTLSAVA